MINQSLKQVATSLLTEKLCEIEEHLQADVLTYYGAIPSDVEGLVKEAIEELREEPQSDKLAVILTTTGGTLTPVERMAHTFRHHYDSVEFYVPDYAYSAGTIFCLSGDKIHMNYFSVLGPIDPQVTNREGRLVGALGYLDKIQEMLDRAEEGTLTEAEFLILRDFDLAELREYEQSKEIAIDMIKRWLPQYKFSNWAVHSDGTEVTEVEREQRAEEIASLLSDNNRWKSHGRPIHMDALRSELRLVIEDFDSDARMKEMLPSYHDLVREHIKNEGYHRLFIQTRKWV